MKRILAGLSLAAAVVVPPALAVDPAAMNQLMTTLRCFNCDLTGADLAGCRIEKADHLLPANDERRRALHRFTSGFVYCGVVRIGVGATTCARAKRGFS